MASKLWGEHTPAWRTKATADGLSPRRYNAWIKLTPTGRKGSSQREYAKGTSVPVQKRSVAEAKALDRMKQVNNGKVRTSTIKKGVGMMDAEDLRWTINATDDQIRRRGRKDTVSKYATNPWWYH